MILRKLNKQGLEEFERYIVNLRSGKQSAVPTYLLTDSETSDPLVDKIELENMTFKSRYELGDYLAIKFKNLDMQTYIGDSGFWAAIALFWFDQLCPEKTNKMRKPRTVDNYLLSEKHWYRPRHAIYTTWQLVDKYGEDVRFLLSKELSVRGELIEQMMARQYFMACEGVIRAASKLYFDRDTKGFKKGSAARKSAGCISRYVIWLQQLELTYDLFTVSSDDLLALAPDEFDRFIATE